MCQKRKTADEDERQHDDHRVIDDSCALSASTSRLPDAQALGVGATIPGEPHVQFPDSGAPCCKPRTG